MALGNAVYVGGGNSRNHEMSRRVHKYVEGAGKWASLPITPHISFALAAVNGFVTVIGGNNIISSLTSADLLHFDPANAGKWKRTLPPMPTKRAAPSAISLFTHVVVTGGVHEKDERFLNTVEVLDTTSLQWSKAAPLPKPTTFMCITACESTNRIYLLGGLTKQGSIRSVFSCLVTDLVESTADVASGCDSGVWEEITEAPYHRMGCVAMHGKLVVASGLDHDDQITKSVHVFDPLSREWSEAGDMAAARSSCSLASTGEGHVVVVGGYTNPRNWMTSLTTDVMECVNLKLD